MIDPMVARAGAVAVALTTALIAAWKTRHAKRESDTLRATPGSSLDTLGPVVLFGTVETSDGEAAMRIAIEEDGILVDPDARPWWWSSMPRRRRLGHGPLRPRRPFWLWRELSRVVHARPFHLRLASGQAVRIVPDASTVLVDELEVVSMNHEGARLREARLEAGERAFVRGVLRVDRDAPEGRSIRTGGSVELLVSTRHLDEVWRVRSARWASILIAAVALALAWALPLPLHLWIIGFIATSSLAFVLLVRTWRDRPYWEGRTRAIEVLE